MRANVPIPLAVRSGMRGKNDIDNSFIEYVPHKSRLRTLLRQRQKLFRPICYVPMGLLLAL